MSLILCIETATTMCSVSLAHKGELLSLEELNEPNVHNRLITVFIEKCLAKAGVTLSMLDAIAVSKGPGSYTGLRIGVSTAKGLCFALDKPLLAINTLQSMAAGFIQQHTELPAHSILCPMIDARRMEVFTAFFNMNVEFIRNTSADVVDENSYAKELTAGSVYFFGDGATKCKSILGANPNAHFVENIFPSAAYMRKLAHQLMEEKKFEDIAYFEPFYLKDFVTTEKKKAV